MSLSYNSNEVCRYVDMQSVKAVGELGQFHGQSPRLVGCWFVYNFSIGRSNIWKEDDGGIPGISRF